MEEALFIIFLLLVYESVIDGFECLFCSEWKTAADSGGSALYHRQKRAWRQCYGQVKKRENFLMEMAAKQEIFLDSLLD